MITYDEAYRTMFNKLVKHVSKKLSTHNAEDLVTSVFVKFWENGITEFHKAYIMAAVNNAVNDHLRKFYKRRESLSKIVKKDFFKVEESKIPDIRGLCSLRNEEKELLSLIARGYTLEKISLIQEVPMGTVKSRIHRITSFIRDRNKNEITAYPTNRKTA